MLHRESLFRQPRLFHFYQPRAKPKPHRVLRGHHHTVWSMVFSPTHEDLLITVRAHRPAPPASFARPLSCASARRQGACGSTAAFVRTSTAALDAGCDAVVCNAHTRALNVSTLLYGPSVVVGPQACRSGRILLWSVATGSLYWGIQETATPGTQCLLAVCCAQPWRRLLRLKWVFAAVR